MMPSLNLSKRSWEPRFPGQEGQSETLNCTCIRAGAKLIFAEIPQQFCFTLQQLSLSRLFQRTPNQLSPQPPAQSSLPGTPLPKFHHRSHGRSGALWHSSLSPVTNQPVRHLWVGDATGGLCRMDPDLDSPGRYAINPATCLSGFAILGGAMALDSVNNLLYFVDNQRVSQGIFRTNYLPAGDSGNGLLDRTSLFNLGGSPAGSTFPAGQTGCAMPGTQIFPNSRRSLPGRQPLVGFGKASTIIKFNNPGAATSTNFGSCQQFAQTPRHRPQQSRRRRPCVDGTRSVGRKS